MLIDTDNIVAMTEANQNFSRVVRLVEDKGPVIILKNNNPRYVLMDFAEFSGLQDKISQQKRLEDELDYCLGVPENFPYIWEIFEENVYCASEEDLYFYQYLWGILDLEGKLPETGEEQAYLACRLVHIYQETLKILLDESFDGVDIISILDHLDDLDIKVPTETDEDGEEWQHDSYSYVEEKWMEYEIGSILRENFRLDSFFYHMYLPFYDSELEFADFSAYFRQGKKLKNLVMQDMAFVRAHDFVSEYF